MKSQSRGAAPKNTLTEKDKRFLTQRFKTVRQKLAAVDFLRKLDEAKQK